MSKARPGFHPVAAKHPERAAVILPRAVGLLRSGDVDALCHKNSLEQAVVAAVRFVHKARACAVTEPRDADDEAIDAGDARTDTGPTTRVYFRLGETASRFAGQDALHPADPDHMVSVAIYPRQCKQWRNYDMAASASARTQLRLALVQECLSTATVGRDPISERITKPYPEMFAPIRWADLSAALTLWWWHHTDRGYTPTAAQTLLALLVHPSLASKMIFRGASAPQLAPPPPGT